jgi:hypothetical protein
MMQVRGQKTRRRVTVVVVASGFAHRLARYQHDFGFMAGIRWDLTAPVDDRSLHFHLIVFIVVHRSGVPIFPRFPVPIFALLLA